MKGEGHWFLMDDGRKAYCLQMNGDKVGDEQVTQHFRDLSTLQAFTASTLSKGSCDSVGWIEQVKN